MRNYYASHHNIHIDFLIYNKISKIPLLVIEVDDINIIKKIINRKK